MAEYIKREALKVCLWDEMEILRGAEEWKAVIATKGAIAIVNEQPAADVVEVVRCKDCIYYHKAHVRCNDGTEKDISEFPPEAFGTLGKYVTGEYGINVGGKCEIDKNNGYAVDKSVFRKTNDFCSRGKREGKNA